MQETDAGMYQCKIQISLNNYVSAFVELLVRKPPIINDNSTQSQVVSEGQSIQLECYASGYPLPRISWRRENNAILPTGGSIARYNYLYKLLLNYKNGKLQTYIFTNQICIQKHAY